MTFVVSILVVVILICLTPKMLWRLLKLVVGASLQVFKVLIVASALMCIGVITIPTFKKDVQGVFTAIADKLSPPTNSAGEAGWSRSTKYKKTIVATKRK